MVNELVQRIAQRIGCDHIANASAREVSADLAGSVDALRLDFVG